MAFILSVDPIRHAVEAARFWSKVVRGPGSSCWIWTGAVGDDGYGSVSIRRPAIEDGGQGSTLREYVVSAPRYALAASLGVSMGVGDVAEHVVCDEPICVRAHAGVVNGGLAHVAVSTQAENLATMGRKGRGGGTVRPGHRRGPDRRARAARSRAIRDAVKAHGWDPIRMAEAIAELQSGDQLHLF